MVTDWRQKVEDELMQLSGEEKEFAAANVEAVRKSCEGYGPDTMSADPTSGARMVVNIASVHVPDFVKNGYKNGYDLGKFRIGRDRPAEKPKTRELVDDALPVTDASMVYFGAASLSGAGIRFYGDVCMVLKHIEDSTVILDRNSYDLLRRPFSSTLKGVPDKLNEKALEISGNWTQLKDIAALKVVFPSSGRTRRMTSGQIASELLDDEDYIEVLKEGRFGHSDVEIARLSSSEAAAASHVESKQAFGPAASAAELLFVHQRRQAIQALVSKGVRVAVTTTSGRTA